MDSDPFSANATSRLSSDFRSAISTSPLEQSLHNAGHMERGHSGCLPSMVTAKRQRSSEAGALPLLEEVYPVWLEASPDERYLLLEDADTGDVLMPLIYMKAVFEANYSRKLSSLKHRLVAIPADAHISKVARPNAYLYWQGAFEAPHNVKLLVRQELGEDNAPQGHLRLMLLPVIYNAMAQKEAMRKLPLFRALREALRASAYDPLLRHPPQDPTTPEKHSSEGGDSPAAGPARTGESGSGTPQRLFGGPRDLESTAAKYMMSFREAEETDVSIKRPRMVHSASHQDLGRSRGGSPALPRSAGQRPQDGYGGADADLRREFREFKRRVTAQLEGVFGELAVVKNCIMQLYNVLLPGKFPPPQPQPAAPPPTAAAPPHCRALPQPPQHPSYQQAHMQARSLAHSGHGLAPPPLLTQLGQLRGSRSAGSLVSHGAPGEASHASATSAVACPPAVASAAPVLAPHVPPEMAALESMASSGLQGLPAHAQMGADFGQPAGEGFMMSHPALQGGAASLGLHIPQLTPLQRIPSQQSWDPMRSMAAVQLAPQHPPFPMTTPWR